MDILYIDKINFCRTSSSTVKASTAPVKFSQLEENINKWTIELEEQEKVFMNQVAHINEWDRLLLSNGDKVINIITAITILFQQSYKLFFSDLSFN